MRTNNNDISTFEKLQRVLRFNTECIKMKVYGYLDSIQLETCLFMLVLRSD